MDNDLIGAFLTTLKDVNATLLDLTKATSSNTLAIKIIGVFLVILGGGFVTWMFAHMDKYIK